jgi:hypothetical protein
MVFRPLGIYRSLYLCIANVYHLPITSKVIKGNSEGVHNATMVPISSYKPNAQSFLT